MRWLNNLRISVKLLTSFLIITVILFVISMIGLSGINSIKDGDDKMYNRVTSPMSKIATIANEFQKIRVAYRDMIRLEDPVQIAQRITERKGYSQKITEASDGLENEFKSEEGKKLFNEFAANREKFIADLSRIEELALANNDAEAITFMEQGSLSKTTALEEELIMKMLNFKKMRGEEFNKANIATYETTRSQVIYLLIAGLIIALILSLVSTREISKPIRRLVDQAERIDAGDLSVKIEQVDRSDELGKLQNSVGQMADTIIEKAVWYEAMLDSIPFPVSVTDMDMNWTFINSATEKLLNMKRSELTGKPCSNWNAAICKTEMCGVHRLRNGLRETFFDQGGGNFKVDSQFIYNTKKEKIGHVEVVQNITESKSMETYLSSNAEILLQEVEKFAEGDLQIELVPKNTDDSIGKLFLGFNSAADKLNQLILGITEAVSATASASSQISSSTEEMASGAQEQSHQTAEVVTAVEQMTKTIIDNTRNATKAAENANIAGKKAKEGGEVVKQTVEGMNAIAKVVLESARTVEELGKSSDQIGEIVQVINDIADQTNLLALNAAIEAARAGDQGRGFAVVADEVRKLAERTTKATKEIAAMIKKIQRETAGAVIAMKQGTEEVERGKTLANRAGAALQEIIQEAERVSDTIRNVAAASEEQSAASEEIAKNVEGINSVTQETASGVQQVARAAEDLNRLTENLQIMVNQFKVKQQRTVRKQLSTMN